MNLNPKLVDVEELVARARHNKAGVRMLCETLEITQRDAELVIQRRAEVHALEDNPRHLWIEMRN